MEVYDVITASQIENGDQIIINGDPIEITKEPIEEGEAVLISGYSHISGDTVIYTLPYDREVELWTA